ncbi:MAG TPA: hypothetical protein VGC88_00820 [Terriglobales bacterium]
MPLLLSSALEYLAFAGVAMISLVVVICAAVCTRPKYESDCLFHHDCL